MKRSLIDDGGGGAHGGAHGWTGNPHKFQTITYYKPTWCQCVTRALC